MQKTINIIGIGHKKGNKKSTGAPYDFHVITGTFNDPEYLQGVACENFPVYEADIASLSVGDNVKIIYHYFNGRIYVDAILPV